MLGVQWRAVVIAFGALGSVAVLEMFPMVTGMPAV